MTAGRTKYRAMLGLLAGQRVEPPLAELLVGKHFARPDLPLILRDLAKSGLKAALHDTPVASAPFDLAPLYDLVETIALRGPRRRRAENWLRQPLRLTGEAFEVQQLSEVELHVADRLRRPALGERVIRIVWPNAGRAGSAPLSADAILTAAAHSGWADVEFRVEVVTSVRDLMAREMVFFPPPDIVPPGRKPAWIAVAHAVVGSQDESIDRRGSLRRSELVRTLLAHAASESHGGPIDELALAALRHAAERWPQQQQRDLKKALEPVDAGQEGRLPVSDSETEQETKAGKPGPAADRDIQPCAEDSTLGSEGWDDDQQQNEQAAFVPGGSPLDVVVRRLIERYF